MTLHVHLGNRLDLLADELVEILAAPLADPFAAEVVAVPTAGVRDLVIRRAARRLGVSANIDFPFPDRFVTAALAGDADDDPWRVDALTWAVLDVLDREVVDVPGWRGACQARRSRRFAVARRIAELFDRYGVNRPEILQQWTNGVPGDGTIGEVSTGGERLVGTLDASFEWQFRLWQHVRSAVGTPSPAEQLPELLERLRAGGGDSGLPDRVSWFGINTLPQSRLAVLGALAASRDVHLWMARPSAAAWEATPPQPEGWLVHRRQFDELAGGASGLGTGNPLLRSWGRPITEIAALLHGAAAADPAGVRTTFADDPAVGSATTLLRHVQADIAADRMATPFAGDPADGSLQVHACHGPTRQLEVLRDVLGHLFVADPTLEPRDVVVLCPDLARFEPFAVAVFGRGTLAVPAVVTDLTLGSENPVARALVTILAALAGRCSALDVLAVAGLDPVRRRFGFTVDDLDRITGWIGRLGTSWGLDAAQRAEVLGPDAELALVGGTWDATVRSLLIGAAMPAPWPRAVGAPLPGGGAVPFDDMPADAVVTAGRLADLLATLRYLRGACASPRPASGWCDVLDEALDLLCTTAQPDRWQQTLVTDAIDEVRRAAAGSTAMLAAEDARAVVDAVVTEYRGRLRMRSGAVTITGLAALRNVPSRVVCLLGFDEASLRVTGVDGDDVLAVRPCLGEPDRRADRRQVVLDALMSARDHFIVVCDGSDITTNRRLRFAVALTELLDVVDASLPAAAGTGDEHESPVVYRHRLRSYDERAFDAESPFGFDDEMRRAASARREGESTSAPTVGARWSIPAVPVEAPGTDVVTLDELVEACTRPARSLLRRRLDVRLPGEVVDIDTSIPLAVSPLDTSGLGRRLLDRYRSAAAATDAATFDRVSLEAAVLDEWVAAESLAGRLPPGELVRQSLDDVSRELLDLVDRAIACVGGALDHRAVLGASGTLELDIAVLPAGADAPLRLVDRLGGIADAGAAGSALCRLSYTRPKPRTEVEAAIHLAAAVVATGRLDWVAVMATRGKNRRTSPTAKVFGAAGGVAGAQRVLDAAATIRSAALCGAVPLFEQASRILHDEGYLDEAALFGDDFVTGDLADADTGFVWNGASSSDILPLGPKEWADLLWGAIDEFVFDWAEQS